MEPERCYYWKCDATFERKDESRCGGLLYGTRDDPGVGCGRLFCEEHLVAGVDPFYCRGCWEQAKLRSAQAARRLIEESRPAHDDKYEQARRRARLELTSVSIYAGLVAGGAEDDWVFEDKARIAVKAAAALLAEVDKAQMPDDTEGEAT